MSLIDDRITNEMVIPTIETRLFDDHEDSHLAIGIVAVGDTVTAGLEEEYKSYLLLRGNVYAKQKNYMPLDDLNDDGTETDFDDGRSIHFAVVENAMDNTRVVGAMRLIIKSRENDAILPIEEHYPEAFADGPTSLFSTEVSRLISRHENTKVQHGLKWLLFTAGVAYVAKRDLGPVYGAVEASLARGLQIEGVPVTTMAEPKFVEEFNATKLPIRVDLAGLTRKIEADQADLLSAIRAQPGDFVYSGVAPMATIDIDKEAVA